MTAADHDQAALPCDHHQQDHAPAKVCKPGMACHASLAALPVQPVAFSTTNTSIVVHAGPERSLASRSPDRSLRPPIAL